MITFDEYKEMESSDLEDITMYIDDAARACHVAWCEANKMGFNYDSMDAATQLMWRYMAYSAVQGFEGDD